MAPASILSMAPASILSYHLLLSWHPYLFLAPQMHRAHPQTYSLRTKLLSSLTMFYVFYSSAIKRNEVLIHVYNVNEPWKHHAKWNKPYTHKTIYTVSPLIRGTQKSKDRKSSGCPAGKGQRKGQMGVKVDGYSISLGGDENVVDCGDGYVTLETQKSHWVVQIKFKIWKFSPKKGYVLHLLINQFHM